MRTPYKGKLNRAAEAGRRGFIVLGVAVGGVADGGNVGLGQVSCCSCHCCVVVEMYIDLCL